MDYIRSGGIYLNIMMVMFVILSIIGTVFTNTWLSKWSDDALLDDEVAQEKSVMRLEVYAGLAAATCKSYQE